MKKMCELRLNNVQCPFHAYVRRGISNPRGATDTKFLINKALNSAEQLVKKLSLTSTAVLQDGKDISSFYGKEQTWHLHWAEITELIRTICHFDEMDKSAELD